MTDERPDSEETRHHVTRLQSIERQVGDHVLKALADDDAVAVLTTIAPGVRHDRVVSLPLSRMQVEAIRGILDQAEEEAAQADQDEQGDGRREGFLGFHTVLEQAEDPDQSS